MSSWRKVRLNQLGTVERGRSRHRPRNDPKLYGGPYPFVQTGDVKAAGLRLTACDQRYSADGLAQSRLWPVGTLCITIAANIGDTTILGLPACFPDSIVGFTPSPGVSDVVFVKYMLDLVKQQFTSISSGATQDNLSLEKLLSQDLWAPAIDEQRRIAAILGAYDDLIEVNRRRVAVLEAMARGLFEEWFVRFRFPGHENYKIIDTPDGPLPDGWQWTNLAHALENFDRLRKPISGQKRLSMQGPYPYYGAAKIFDYIDGFLFNGLYLLFAEDGSVITPDGYPVLQLVDGQFWVNNHAHVVRGKAPFTTELIYLALERLPISGYITGAAQPKITQGNLNRILIREADEDTMQRFGAIVAEQFALILSIRRTNETLAKARDLLLPRLISGELSVAAVERGLKAAV